MSALPPAFGYQQYMRQKVASRKRTAIIAPPGAGKTRPVIEGVGDLGGFSQAVLIVCSGSAISTWKRQIPLWGHCPDYADEIHIVRGNKEDRIELWKQAKDTNYGTYITNASVFLRDYGHIQKHAWNAVLADEYHKFMRRHKGETFKKFRSMTRHIPILVLATGSLARRNASSMFTAFTLVAPQIWRSYWKYVKAFCYIDDSGYGQRVYGVKNAESLRKVMDEYFAYIPPEVVADEMPEGRRVGIDVEMDSEQTRIYDELDQEMISIVGSGVIVAQTIFSKITRIRQLLCCPRILDESLGLGAAYAMTVESLEDQPHVIIFVPFRPACDHFAEDLSKRGYKNVFILRGGTDDVEQQEIINKFRETKGILLCTIQYAESFDCESCDTSHFIGYDLTVDQNEQAEGRTRRNISKHEFVTWNYYKYNCDIDQHFLYKLGEDADNVRLIMGRSDEYIRKVKDHKN